MRLIDGDAFDSILADGEIKARKSRKYVLESAINTIRGNLANAPTIEPAQQWIPVTERLPEKAQWNDAFLVTVQCEHVDGWDDYVVCGAEYTEYGWEYVPYPIGAIKVVAWMPVQIEPYEEETAK